MSYNVRDDNAILGPNASIELGNGAGQSTLVKQQLVEFLTFFAPAAANAVNNIVFVAPAAPSAASGALPLGQYSLMEVQARWGANTGANAATLQVQQVPSGTAMGSGTNLLATAINLQTTANTTVSAFPSASLAAANQVLAAGDSLALIFTGTLTGLANCAITLAISRSV